MFAGVCIVGSTPWAATGVGVRRHASRRAPRHNTRAPAQFFTQELDQWVGVTVQAP